MNSPKRMQNKLWCNLHANVILLSPRHFHETDVCPYLSECSFARCPLCSGDLGSRGLDFLCPIKPSHLAATGLKFDDSRLACLVNVRTLCMWRLVGGPSAVAVVTVVIGLFHTDGIWGIKRNTLIAKAATARTTKRLTTRTTKTFHHFVAFWVCLYRYTRSLDSITQSARKGLRGHSAGLYGTQEVKATGTQVARAQGATRKRALREIWVDISLMKMKWK